MDFQEVGWEPSTGFVWLRIGAAGGLLWILQWTLGFHDIRGSSWWLAEEEGFCSTHLVSYFTFFPGVLFGKRWLRHRCGAMSVRYEQHFTVICKQFWPSLVERSVPTWRCAFVSLNCAGCGGWEYASVRPVHRNRGEILKYHKWVGF